MSAGSTNDVSGLWSVSVEKRKREQSAQIRTRLQKQLATQCQRTLIAGILDYTRRIADSLSARFVRPESDEEIFHSIIGGKPECQHIRDDRTANSSGNLARLVAADHPTHLAQIGRASCRERVCQYV